MNAHKSCYMSMITNILILPLGYLIQMEILCIVMTFCQMMLPTGNRCHNHQSTKTHLQPIKSPLAPLYERGG